MQKAPRGEAEVNFYEQVWGNHHGKEVSEEKHQVLKQLRDFVPRFYGVKTLSLNGKGM